MDHDRGRAYRLSPDRLWASGPGLLSQQASNNSPPSCSQPNDGFRITWGPSASTILDGYVCSDKDRRPGILAKVKRTSANAGLASPTRPGAASNALSTSAASTSYASNSLDTSGSSSGSSTSNASRFSKRRRRLQTSSSASSICFDSPADTSRVEAACRRGQRAQSVDETSAEMMDMFGELARRLEENRRAAAERERTSSRTMMTPSTALHPPPPLAVETIKGKQREKVALSPACSTVAEETMSQGLAGMVIATHTEGSHSRPNGMGSSSNTARAPLSLNIDGKSHVSTSTPKAATSAGTIPSPSLTKTHHPRTSLQRNTSQRDSEPAINPPIIAAPVPLAEKASARESARKDVAQPSSKVHAAAIEVDENEFWEDNDKSLELAMSQMEIPEPPLSQHAQAQPESNPQASLSAKDAAGLPKPASQALSQGGKGQYPSWEPFKSRDKRIREKSSEASSTSSGGKLSSKPLVATTTQHRNTNNGARLSNTTQEPLSKAASHAGSGAAQRISTKIALADSTNLKVTIPPKSTSARASSATTSSEKLFKAFKPPTITNRAAAKAEQEKKAAAAKVVVNKAQPLNEEDAWMEDMDWSVEESF